METTSDTGKRRREVLEHLFTPEGKPRAGLEDAPPLSSADVAALFQMSERSIRMWAAKGELPHMRTLGGGRLLYPADQIATLYVEHYAGTIPQRSESAGGIVESTRTREL